MKHILIFSLQYYPLVGGAEVALKEITDRITPADFEFHMVTLRFDSTLPRLEKVGNIFVHRIGFARPHPTATDLRKFPLHLNKHYYQFAAALHATALHRTYHFDGMWAMMAHASGIPAGLFKRVHPRIPYLLTLQEGDPLQHIEKIMRPVWPLFRQGFVRADQLQAISTFLLHWGKRLGFAGAGVVIPNGVDTKRFSAPPTSEEQASAQALLKKKPGETWLITTSRLVYKNGLDTVISALPLLPETVHFAIAGVGPLEQSLRAQAEALGCGTRVHFLGQVPYNSIPALLSISDIFIRPSRSEGMGNSFIEAMAAGIPVIATQEGGISDFLFDAKRNPEKETTGWAVDCDGPQQIAQTVQDITMHPEQVPTVTATARAMVQQNYDWNDVAAHMTNIFTNLGSTAH